MTRDRHDDRGARSDVAGREIVPGVVLTPDGRIGPRSRDRADRPFVELVRFLSDTARLLWRVARDPRVPWHAKAVAGGAMVYVLSPIDLIPDFIPGAGSLDDLYLIVRAIRYLAGAAGYDLLQELWPGSRDSFALLLLIAGVKA